MTNNGTNKPNSADQIPETQPSASIGEKTDQTGEKKSDVENAIDEAEKAALIPAKTATEINTLAARLVQSGEKLDENPEALDQAAKVLKEAGAVEKDIDEATLVLETDIDRKNAILNRLARTSNTPTANYQSNVGFYGVQARLDESKPGQPELLYHRGMLEELMCWAENKIRKANDLGGSLIGSLFRKGRREKVSIEQALIHSQELGLDGFRIENGLLVEDARDIRTGAMLDDVIRQDESGQGNQFLKGIGKVEAIEAASLCLAETHKRSKVGIGEVLANDLVLKIEEGKLIGARLTFPDTCYEESVDQLEQKATDMLDFCFSLGSAGMQSGGLEKAREFISAGLSKYDLEMTKMAMRALLNERPAATGHNMVRLGYDRVKDKKVVFEEIRKIVDTILAEQSPKVQAV
ncbi:hypothetical protein IT412_01430 [Candidatus Peregrinibacteria bacterium]|nr:hypothetical protein [Candidatus Peregrinibacteria bacterium]